MASGTTHGLCWRDQDEHAVHGDPVRCAAGSPAAVLLLLAAAARWVSVYGMLILVAPTALAVGSGVNSTRIVSTTTLTCLVAASGEACRPVTVGGWSSSGSRFWAVHLPYTMPWVRVATRRPRASVYDLTRATGSAP